MRLACIRKNTTYLQVPVMGSNLGQSFSNYIDVNLTGRLLCHPCCGQNQKGVADSVFLIHCRTMVDFSRSLDEHLKYDGEDQRMQIKDTDHNENHEKYGIDATV